MELQLTKTKTITIGGGGGAGARRTVSDLVGIDLFSGDPRGCPAVRLSYKKNELRVVAAGFVPPPPAALPDTWESASKKCVWALPSEFQAPTAALSITSPDMFFAQATREAFQADLASGGHHEEARETKAKRIGIVRPAAKTPAKPAEPAGPAPIAEPGLPVSNGGTRFVMRPMSASDGFVLESGLPEYQVLWLSRLLPEGRRPTASSILLRPSAMAASLLKSAALAEAGGTALAIFVEENTAHVAGYKNGALVLWRECTGWTGWASLREQIKNGLGISDEMVESVLEDTLIDPRPVLEQALAPIFRELAVSRDYLIGKLDADPKSVFVLGLKAGLGYWNDIARAQLGLPLVAPSVFDGLAVADRLNEQKELAGAAGHAFLPALGAALARLSDEDPSGADLHLNLLAESERLSPNPIRVRVMLPLLAMFAGVGMLVWWGLLFGKLLMVSSQGTRLDAALSSNKAAHAQALARMAEVLELEAEHEQLTGYALSRRPWGPTLSALAEVMPIKVQLTKLEIPPPPPQILTPPGWKGPAPWGPTGTVEEVTLLLSGRTPKETPVISLMETLEGEAFTNALIIAKDPNSPHQSPRVRSFRQDVSAHGNGPRMLAFEIEYRARERRFAP